MTIEWATVLTALIGVIPTMMTIVLSHMKLTSRMDKTEARNRIYTDSTIKSLNGTASAMINSYPGPCYIKMATADQNGNITFIMHDLNAHYEKLMDIPRYDWLGKTDLEAGLSQERSKREFEQDLAVWASGTRAIYEMEVNGEMKKFVKVRLDSPGGETKGIFSYQLAIDNMGM